MPAAAVLLLILFIGILAILLSVGMAGRQKSESLSENLSGSHTETAGFPVSDTENTAVFVPDRLSSAEVSSVDDVDEASSPAEDASADAVRPSLLDFLKIAVQPVGQTMYVWGGGWNEEDTAAGIEAVTIGVSPRWAEFASRQTSSYDHNTTRYQIHDGLDCSGYVGWAVYNVLETQNGLEGYVGKSTQMAQVLASRGLGTYISASAMTDWQPGDICSMKGHVWISLGMCSDGSVLLLHASPPGVIFSGTLLADGSTSQAINLAKQIMSSHFPEWYEKFPDCSRSYSYLTGSSAMRWSQNVLSDPEAISRMEAQDVVTYLFD